MKILLVGALAWNPERVISLCERGHRLFGLWTRTMAWEQGPYEFAAGYITDLTLENYAEKIKEEKIDIIYSLFQAYLPSAWVKVEDNNMPDIWSALRKILNDRNKGLFDIPIVRHWGFDIDCIDPEVIYALDGHIFCNRQKYDFWVTEKSKGGLGLVLPYDPGRIIFMDGDMPKQEFMNNDFSQKLSCHDGELHTVCIGRPIYIDYHSLAARKIHVHLYGNSANALENYIIPYLSLPDIKKYVGRYIHFHHSLQTINATLAEIRLKKNRWVREFSKYDAGWSYVKMTCWAPLNDKAAIPSRLSTYALAGLPVIAEKFPGYYRYDILKDNDMQIDLEAADYDDLEKKLKDRVLMDQKTQNAIACRERFSFDYYIDNLIGYLYQVKERYARREASPQKIYMRVSLEPQEPPALKRTMADKLSRIVIKIRGKGPLFILNWIWVRVIRIIKYFFHRGVTILKRRYCRRKAKLGNLPNERYKDVCKDKMSHSRGCVFFNFGTSYILRLIVSIYTLRQVYNGPVTLFLDNTRCHNRLAKELRKFDIDIQWSGVNGFHHTVVKPSIFGSSPYKTTLLFDGDLLFIRPFDELWAPLEEKGVLLTRFYPNPYGAHGSIDRKGACCRIDHLNDIRHVLQKEEFEAASDGLLNRNLDINIGVMGCVKGKSDAFLRELDERIRAYAAQERIIKFPVDEMLTLALSYRYQHYLAEEKWNCPEDEFFRRTDIKDANIIHYFAEGLERGGRVLGRSRDTEAGKLWFAKLEELSRDQKLDYWLKLDPFFNRPKKGIKDRIAGPILRIFR